MRKKHTMLLEVVARCASCGWVCEARNAMGAGVRHHDATGHIVDVIETRQTSYGVDISRGDTRQPVVHEQQGALL